MMNLKNKTSLAKNNSSKTENKSESGFSLVEVIIAMMILLIALLGVSLAFTYSVSYNTGNYARSQALAVLQKQAELIRSAKFTPNGSDPILQGGVKTPIIETSEDGNRFRVDVTVDNDPDTEGVQTTEAGVTLKEITVPIGEG